MVPNFRKFVFESLDDETKKEIRALGFGGVDVNEVASEFKKIAPDYSLWKVEPDGNVLKATLNQDIDPDVFFDEKRIYRQMERYVNQEVELIFDFENDKLTVNWSVSQKDINLDESGTYYETCSDYIYYEQDSSPAEVAEELDELLHNHPLEVFGLIKDTAQQAANEYFREDYDDEDEEDYDEEDEEDYDEEDELY